MEESENLLMQLVNADSESLHIYYNALLKVDPNTLLETALICYKKYGQERILSLTISLLCDLKAELCLKELKKETQWGE